MIERRPFDELASEDLGWLKARRHFSSDARDDPSRSGWGCVRVWNDEEIAPNAGRALQVHANIEVVTYVREGTVTHTDSLGNEGRIEAGNEYVLREPRLAYLVPSFGSIEVNGVRIHARDGAAIKNIDIVSITAIEGADLVMVDVL